MHCRASQFLSLSIAIAAAALSACGGDDDGSDDSAVADAAPPEVDASRIDPDAAPLDAGLAREIIEETQPLVPGELVEATLNGGPDDFAVIHLEAPVAELDWNIHGHAGGGTQTVFEELNQMTVDHVFTPEAEADWSLLLRNSGAVAMEIEIRVELHGEMTWEWQ